MVDAELISLVTPYGFQRSSCGYCGSQPGKRSETESSRSYGMRAHQLSARVYGLLCDAGWRRSGTYCYKMDNGRTCCPHITIRCLATGFRASKSQRQRLNRFAREVKSTGALKGRSEGGAAPYVAHEEMRQGSSKDLDIELPDAPSGNNISLEGTRIRVGSVKTKGKGKDNAPFNLLDTFAEIEGDGSRLTIQTEPSSFTVEKFELFRLYQKHVHNDDDATERGFKRFLCDSPLVMQKAAEGIAYGSFHQLYYLDGELVAIGVIDILPTCLSSVYFIWHPEYAELSLGKVGALQEIALVQQLARTLPELKYYYMGFYIHSCAKMRYKAEYKPCELADMIDYTFHSFDHCGPLLEQHERALFSPSSTGAFGPALRTRAESSMSETEVDGMPTGWLDPTEMSQEELRRLLGQATIWSNRTVLPLLRSPLSLDSDLMQTALEGLAALGDLGSQIVLALA